MAPRFYRRVKRPSDAPLRRPQPRSAAWMIALLTLACEPGTCSSPPPPAIGEPCREHPDQGLCAKDGASALLCVEGKWTVVDCTARRCEQRQGQPSFAGRYQLRCGAARANVGEACVRVGEETYGDKDPGAVLTCRGKVWVETGRR